MSQDVWVVTLQSGIHILNYIFEKQPDIDITETLFIIFEPIVL